MPQNVEVKRPKKRPTERKRIPKKRASKGKRLSKRKDADGRDPEWNCEVTVRNRKRRIVARIRRPELQAQGVKQGIEEAFRILRGCESCRKLFFGKDYPIDFLEKLNRIEAIFVSEKVPVEMVQVGGPKGRWRVRRIGTPPLENWAAGIVDLSSEPANPPYPMIEPCIYVNPKQLLVEDMGPHGDGFNLAHERAMMIIHELAHAAGVIFDDSVNEHRSNAEAERLSRKNSKCITENCLLSCSKGSFCFDNPTPPPNPWSPRRSSPKHQLSNDERKTGFPALYTLGRPFANEWLQPDF